MPRYGRLRAMSVGTVLGGATSAPLPPRLKLCGWSLLYSFGSGVPAETSGAFAAAAAGSLTLTSFSQVASVLVTPAAAWPAGTNQITITNIAGGPLVVDIPGGTTSAVAVNFPIPIANSGTPVVSVPAIVGGPAYTIDATGTQFGSLPGTSVGSATINDAGQIMGISTASNNQSDTRWLTVNGLEVTTGLTVTANNGVVTGCLYVVEAWPGDGEVLASG